MHPRSSSFHSTLGAVTDGATPPALARLFAMAFRDLIEDLHERLDQRGWSDVRPPYGFVLLAAREEPTTAAELAALLGISKQATSQLIDAMSHAGYVRRERSEADARERAIVLTARGRELLTAVEAIYEELDAEWADIIGRPALETLRSAVTRVLLDRHDGQLPPVRPGW
jgi:DNA-binding MarR family transcriptional regulator